LGARLGVVSEEAFREGVRALLGRELGWRVERWFGRDDEGLVFGYPRDVEVDVVVRDDRVILVEIKAHASALDVIALLRKAELYRRKTGRAADRLVLIMPYAEEDAREAAELHGVEPVTGV